MHDTIFFIFAHNTWALAQVWALSIRTAKTVIWTLTQEWALSIRTAKTVRRVLNWEWALALVHYSTVETGCYALFAVKWIDFIKHIVLCELYRYFVRRTCPASHLNNERSVT